MTRIVVACLLLAALSLLGPSEPSYDPWAWLVWGRELAHFGLDTTGGPSWKPLPVAFTTLFAPFGAVDDRIPVTLWLLVARAGGLLALALCFRVAGRLLGGGRTRRWLAGGIAVIAVVLTPGWIRYMFHGNEAPMAIALSLWALERHLDGRRGWALELGGLVCLARPELFAVLLLYAAWLWWRTPERRRLIVAVLALVPAAWLIPSWIGSGNPLLAGQQARSEPSWSLSLAPVPWKAALDLAQSQTWVVLEAGALVAVGLALAALLGARRDRPGPMAALASAPHREAGLAPRPTGPAAPAAIIALAAFSAAIAFLYAAMTQAGFSGNVRYVLPALVALAIVGGIGAALAVDVAAVLARRAATRLRPATPRAAALARFGPAAAASLAVLVLLLAATPATRTHLHNARLEADESIQRTHLNDDLARAVDQLSPGYVLMFGPATVNRTFQTALAYQLGVPIAAIHGARGRGVVFRAPTMEVTGVVRVYEKARARTRLARVGPWHVSARPPRARHIFTWPIVGFRLRTAAARVAQQRNPGSGRVLDRRGETERIRGDGATGGAAGARA